MLPIKSFKLSRQGRIASAVSMALVLPFISGAAIADDITPVGDTTVSKVGNVDVVNIANPNGQGLSHNRYEDFNVGKAGAVLNNSLAAGESQLAGQLEANDNLTDKTATVILNEVVTKNPSLLLGQQEVFGMAADYVLANPNGITCEGCGFINTTRSTLAVGTPTIADERLAGFDIGDQQSNSFTLRGEMSGNKRLDLLAPKVDIDGNIKASDALNVITGRNHVNYDDNAVSSLTGNQPSVTLDGSILGSMQSGRIRLHNTDAAATQTLQGSFTADESLQAAAAGRLEVLGSDIQAKDISLIGDDSLNIGGFTTTSREDVPSRQEKLDDRVTLTQSGYNEKENYQGSTISGNDVGLHGGDVQVTGSQLTADNLSAHGNNISIDGAVTTNTVSETARKSKGLWFNEDESRSTSQDYHKSSLQAKDSLVVAADNDLSLAGAALQADQMDLSAKGQIVGGAEVTENTQSQINRYKNETANLKSGERNQTEASQQAHLTSIKGGQVSLISGGDQRLEGATISADSASFTSGKDLTLTTAAQQDRQTDEEAFKYWGGIGGGETNINNQDQTQLIGTQVTAKKVRLSSGADLNINASNINSSNNINNASNINNSINTTPTPTKSDATSSIDMSAAKAINITHDFDTKHAYSENRHGTAFNLTDKKQVSERKAETTVASSIQGQNIAASGDTVFISGAQVAADDALDINAASTLTTDVANATDITETETFGIESGVDAGLEEGATVNVNGNIKGVTTIIRTGSGSGSGNQLSGKHVNLSAQDVSLKASDIDGVKDVTITGDNVATGAGEALVAESSKVVKRTGPEAYVKGGLSGVKVGVSLGTDQTIDQHHEYQAVNSDIDAGASASLTAKESLTNQGTQLSAQDVTLSAQDIVNQSSHDRTVDRNVIAGGQGALEAFAGTSPLVGGAISLSGQGTGTTTETKAAHVTHLQADNDVSIKATNTAVDEGTAIAAKNINISAEDYEGGAAFDSAVTTVHAGKGDVSIDANTSNFSDINITVGGKGRYQYLQEGDAKAVKGSLIADNVTIDAGTRAVAAQDVQATNYQVTAGNEARIGQNSDKQWKTQGGAHLGGSVGATIIPAAQAGAPSFSGEAGFNYLNVEDSLAQAAEVTANDVKVAADTLAQIDGAKLLADNVTVTGSQANIAAAQDRHRAVGVNLDGNAALSLSIADNTVNSGSAGLGGNLGVINESTNQAHGATINTDSLTVTANDTDTALRVEGANINAQNVHLSNTGDVDVIAAASKSNVGNFAIGGNLSAGASSDAFKKGNVEGHLNVESDDSIYYTLGDISADAVTIHSGRDLNLQSNVTAGRLTTSVGNDFNISSAQDVVKKVNLDTAINVGGSPVVFDKDTSAEDVLNAFQNDFKNGTILGVKAGGKFGFLVDHQQVTHQANVHADTLDAHVGSQNINVDAARVSADSADVRGADIQTSNNDDFVHTIGASVAVKTPNLSQILDDAIAGNELDKPIEIEGTFEWEDTDGDNTKAAVDL